MSTDGPTLVEDVLARSRAYVELRGSYGAGTLGANPRRGALRERAHRPQIQPPVVHSHLTSVPSRLQVARDPDELNNDANQRVPEKEGSEV